MKILLCGASGFVGRHLEKALLEAGHQVTRGVRQPRNTNDVAIDYRNDTEIATWIPRLSGIEAVVNAVGVLRDSKAQPMAKLHDAVPRALFAAAAQSGVKRIVQISALGVGTGIPSAYMQTKQKADDFLQTLNVDWAILRARRKRPCPALKSPRHAPTDPAQSHQALAAAPPACPR